MSRAHREELKRLWFSLDRTNTPIKKEVIVEINFGHVEILSDGPDGYSSFKTNQGSEALKYAKERMKNEEKLKEYKLVIK